MMDDSLLLYKILKNRTGAEISASGNPVVLTNMREGQSLDITASWELTQEGEGNPSPDNIRPITGRDSIMVERCGENIVNIPIDTVVNGVNVKQEADGRYYLKGTLINDGFSLPMKNIELPPGTYSVKIANLNNVVITLRKVVNGSTSAWIKTTDNIGGKTGKLTERTTISFAMYGSANLLKAGMEIDGYMELMLVANSVQPDTYIPYQGDALELQLPSTIYGGNLNLNGNGQQEWALLTFDGTENWTLGVGATKNYKFYHINNKANPLSACICNTFPWKQYAYASEGNEGFFAFESNGLAIHYNVTNTWSTLDDWKAFLADQYAKGTPVQIAYKLAEPIPFKVTGGKIKALAGTNTIMTDADSVTVKSGTDTMRAKKLAVMLGD